MYIHQDYFETVLGYFQIGMTTEPSLPLSALHSRFHTPSTCHFAARVTNPAFTMERIREILESSRIHHDGMDDFYTGEPNIAISAIRIATIEESTVAIQPSITIVPKQEPSPAKPDRPNIDFTMLDIPLGATLHYSSDPNITCTVTSLKPPLVEMNGLTMHLSAATTQIKGNKSRWQGPRYWLYQGESLVRRRHRLERESSLEKPA